MLDKNKDNVELLEKVMEHTEKENVQMIDWNGVSIKIQKNLSLEEMMSFVKDVVASSFATATNEYLPEIKYFSIDCCILEYYTDLLLPSRIEKKYELIYNTDIIDFVKRYISDRQINLIVEAVNERIEYLLEANISSIENQMNRVAENFNSIGENISKIFDGIDNETISKIASTIANGTFSEEKLLQAFRDESTSDKEA